MLGKLIKNYINDKGLKQKRIAELAGIQITRFNEIVNGKRPIEATEYFRVCEALSVPIDTFAKKLKNVS